MPTTQLRSNRSNPTRSNDPSCRRTDILDREKKCKWEISPLSINAHVSFIPYNTGMCRSRLIIRNLITEIIRNLTRSEPKPRANPTLITSEKPLYQTGQTLGLHCSESPMVNPRLPKQTETQKSEMNKSEQRNRKARFLNQRGNLAPRQCTETPG